MKVLGFDPGMKRMGISVIERNELGNIELIDFGYFSNERNPKDPYNKFLNEAIQSLADAMPKIIYDYAPNIIVSETVPVGRLGNNTELVVAAITVVKVIAYQFGIPWIDMGANKIKLLSTDNGTASKAQVKNAVFNLFPQVKEEHKKERERQKAEGIAPSKATGIPQDVFDGIAVALAGLLFEEEKRKNEQDNIRPEIEGTARSL